MEAEPLKFQTGMSKVAGRGVRRTLPLTFTQEGIAMLSSVLRSEQALISHKDLAYRLDRLEERHEGHFKCGVRRDPKSHVRAFRPTEKVFGLNRKKE